MSYTDILGVTVEEFPTCPECAAEGKPDCYPLAPSTWYPFADLPMWHWMWNSMCAEVEAADESVTVSVTTPDTGEATGQP